MLLPSCVTDQLMGLLGMPPSDATVTLSPRSTLDAINTTAIQVRQAANHALPACAPLLGT